MPALPATPAAAVADQPAGAADLERRVLQSIYHLLLGDPEPATPQGAHWERIGFQGDQPWTDLRSTGLLSLLHMLCFAESHPEAARHCLAVSRAEGLAGFPLMVASINCSLIAMQALRCGRLSRFCNEAEACRGLAEGCG